MSFLKLVHAFSSLDPQHLDYMAWINPVFTPHGKGEIYSKFDINRMPWLVFLILMYHTLLQGIGAAEADSWQGLYWVVCHYIDFPG